MKRYKVTLEITDMGDGEKIRRRWAYPSTQQLHRESYRQYVRDAFINELDEGLDELAEMGELDDTDAIAD